jgi:hypothetical protein
MTHRFAGMDKERQTAFAEAAGEGVQAGTAAESRGGDAKGLGRQFAATPKTRIQTALQFSNGVR